MPPPRRHYYPPFPPVRCTCHCLLQSILSLPLLLLAGQALRAGDEPPATITFKHSFIDEPTKPEVAVRPEVADKPEVGVKQEVDIKPEVGVKPEMDIKPDVAVKPEVGVKPEVDMKPEVSVKPEVADEPEVVIIPEVAVKLEVARVQRDLDRGGSDDERQDDADSADDYIGRLEKCVDRTELEDGEGSLYPHGKGRDSWGGDVLDDSERPRNGHGFERTCECHRPVTMSQTFDVKVDVLSELHIRHNLRVIY